MGSSPKLLVFCIRFPAFLKFSTDKFRAPIGTVKCHIKELHNAASQGS